MLLRGRTDLDYALVRPAEHGNFYVPVLCSCDKPQVIGSEGPQVFPAILKFLKIVT